MNPFNKSLIDENFAFAGLRYLGVSVIPNYLRISSKSGISKSDPSPEYILKPLNSLKLVLFFV